MKRIRQVRLLEKPPESARHSSEYRSKSFVLDDGTTATSLNRVDSFLTQFETNMVDRYTTLEENNGPKRGKNKHVTAIDRMSAIV